VVSKAFFQTFSGTIRLINDVTGAASAFKGIFDAYRGTRNLFVNRAKLGELVCGAFALNDLLSSFGSLASSTERMLQLEPIPENKTELQSVTDVIYGQSLKFVSTAAGC